MNVTCPHCHRANDRTTCADPNNPDAQPNPGDVNLCFNCGGPSIFTEDSPRLPTEEELEQLLANPRIVHAQISIREIHLKAGNG
ncbi:hypothetical protein [Rhodococcus pyridinivorans]|uniref:Uncharacterized protein n=1 Tax=Rhodococcus pyridinivorans TaxID=103816 RepID=A0A7M2XQD0_9NOCA|nr:hypothetical protein [Rhodococcus pyridinivorans]QOV99542.1 hypothetical protein INP59_03835 [Rhodococcus pyridinivorans]